LWVTSATSSGPCRVHGNTDKQDDCRQSNTKKKNDPQRHFILIVLFDTTRSISIRLHAPGAPLAPQGICALAVRAYGARSAPTVFCSILYQIGNLLPATTRRHGLARRLARMVLIRTGGAVFDFHAVVGIIVLPYKGFIVPNTPCQNRHRLVHSLFAMVSIRTVKVVSPRCAEGVFVRLNVIRQKCPETARSRAVVIVYKHHIVVALYLESNYIPHRHHPVHITILQAPPTTRVIMLCRSRRRCRSRL